MEQKSRGTGDPRPLLAAPITSTVPATPSMEDSPEWSSERRVKLAKVRVWVVGAPLVSSGEGVPTIVHLCVCVWQAILAVLSILFETSDKENAILASLARVEEVLSTPPSPDPWSEADLVRMRALVVVCVDLLVKREDVLAGQILELKICARVGNQLKASCTSPTPFITTLKRAFGTAGEGVSYYVPLTKAYVRMSAMTVRLALDALLHVHGVLDNIWIAHVLAHARVMLAEAQHKVVLLADLLRDDEKDLPSDDRTDALEAEVVKMCDESRAVANTIETTL